MTSFLWIWGWGFILPKDYAQKKVTQTEKKCCNRKASDLQDATMKAKTTPKPATTLVNFRLPHTSIAKLNDVATVMRRTRKSIVDQLIEKFCDVKNLQP